MHATRPKRCTIAGPADAVSGPQVISALCRGFCQRLLKCTEAAEQQTPLRCIRRRVLPGLRNPQPVGSGVQAAMSLRPDTLAAVK